ncbi:MAG: helix-turn-helix domain-containing protein [Candidatus Brockarchaeota archaeon]|nr:helix-turn-helix domain-containing protein [Candidatus Brockarchaeota archaeon]
MGVIDNNTKYQHKTNFATSKRKLELERKFGKPMDNLLAERIAAGKSVNQICKELSIGKQTFYSWTEEYQLKR